MSMDYQNDDDTVSVSDIVRLEDQKQKSFFFFSTIAFSMTIGIFEILGGFVYGDYYGRKHAQFDNTELRQHYAGQCYAYIETTLKKSIKTSLEKTSGKKEQIEKLDELKAMLQNLQLDVDGMNGLSPKTKDRPKNKNRDKQDINTTKKKVASAN